MNIVVWTKEGDPFCREAIHHLQKAKKEFVEKCIGNGYTVEQLIAENTAAASELPALFIDGKFVGGLREIHGLIR